MATAKKYVSQWLAKASNTFRAYDPYFLRWGFYCYSLPSTRKLFSLLTHSKLSPPIFQLWRKRWDDSSMEDQSVLEPSEWSFLRLLVFPHSTLHVRQTADHSSFGSSLLCLCHVTNLFPIPTVHLATILNIAKSHLSSRISPKFTDSVKFCNPLSKATIFFWTFPIVFRYYLYFMFILFYFTLWLSVLQENFLHPQQQIPHFWRNYLLQRAFPLQILSFTPESMKRYTGLGNFTKQVFNKWLMKE